MGKATTIDKGTSKPFVVCRNAENTVFHYVELEPQHELITGQPIVEQFATKDEAQTAAGILDEPEEYTKTDGKPFYRVSSKQDVPFGAVKI